MKTLLYLLKKEFLQFKRDKLLPRIAFIYPFMVVLVIPLVTTMDVKHVSVAIVDHDGSTLSQRIMADMAENSFFTLTRFDAYPEALESVEWSKNDLILEFPHDMQKSFGNGVPKIPHLFVNGVNGIKGSLGSQYVVKSVSESIRTYFPNLADKSADKIAVQYKYNPTLNYRHYMIPSLMVMLIIMLCGFLPALNLVNEKEKGTIEQINVTPVPTLTFILSKLIPYWILGIIILTITMVIAFAVYGLVPAGGFLTIYLSTLLFVLVMSGFGVIIANYSQTMTQSMFMMFFIIVICVFMSGLITPITSMPEWAYNLTYIVPPRYYIDVMRSVYLKGSSVSQLSVDFIALATMAFVLNILAWLTYKKQK